MRDGWIKLHRKILDNEELMRSDNAYKLFTVLLMLVDRTTGQWTGGRFQLSRFARIPNGSTYKALKRLENLEMVALSSSSQFTTVSICNWHFYQGNGSTKGYQQGSSKVAAGYHYNNNKERRIKNNTGLIKKLDETKALLAKKLDAGK